MDSGFQNAAFFTRGKPGDEDMRGLSMVEKHQLMQEEAKKREGEETLAKLLPGVSKVARTAALESFDYNVEEAFKMLREFKKETGEGRAAETEELRKRKVEISDSDDSGASGSESSDSDSGRDKKKRKKEKKGKNEKRGKNEKKEKKGKKEKKEKKKEKKEKKDKGEKKLALTEVYGKYGVIKESDLWDKRPEFAIWAHETKQIDVDGLSKWEEKEMFSEFCEDYNTATLPHKKYYDMEQWELKERAKRLKKGASARDADTETMLNDEEQVRMDRNRAREESKSSHLMMLKEVLGNSGTAAQMRDQERLKQEMQLQYKTGNMAEARKIAERLKPDEAQWDAETGKYRKKAGPT